MSAFVDPVVAKATDDAFIKVLANVLTRMVTENETDKGVITRFHSMNVPAISISDYVARIARHVRCSNECFVLALVYIDRIMKLHKEFTLSLLNVHRLIITAVMLAAKFSDDVYYSNKFYAQVGGVKVAEINLLEAQFLVLINYQLYVSAVDYEACRMGVGKANFFINSQPLWGVWHSSLSSPQHRRAKYKKDYYTSTMSTDATFINRGSGGFSFAPPATFSSQYNNVLDYQSQLLKKQQWPNYAAVTKIGHLYTDIDYSSSCNLDDCEAFVVALESRFRDGMKRKCSLKAHDFKYDQECFYRPSNSIVHASKVKEPAW